MSFSDEISDNDIVSEDEHSVNHSDISHDGDSSDMDMDELVYWGQPRFPTIENVQVQTEMRNKPSEVRTLRKALADGDESQNRLPLPMNVVEKILRMADYYYCIVEKKALSGFEGGNMNHCLFSLGPLPAKPSKVEILVTSHDQGWSGYPQDRGTKNNSWTWGEIDVLDSEGTSKTNGRKRVFTNLHADSAWQTHSLKYEGNESFLEFMTYGDTLKMHFRSEFPGWVIFVQNARMRIWLDLTNPEN